MNERSHETIVDYLGWRGDITFEQSGLNVVDALAFSILTYISFDMVSLYGKNDNNSTKNKWFSINDAYEQLKGLDSNEYCSWILQQDDYVEFFKKIAHTKRFRDIKVAYYVKKSDDKDIAQFAGMTFMLPDNKAFVAYRGTDKSMTGWQEDFSMSFLQETHGQSEAVDYLNMIASEFSGEILVGGHSKGGNFAVWAAANMNKQYKDRVTHVFNNDGPGFSENFLKSKEFLDIEYKILSFVPESSVVGVLMNYCDYLVIKSNNLSFMQHDPLSWLVFGKGFIYDAERSFSGKKIESAMTKVMEYLPEEKKAQITKELFNTLDEKNINDLDELKNYIPQKSMDLFFEIVDNIKDYKDDFQNETLDKIIKKYKTKGKNEQ